MQAFGHLNATDRYRLKRIRTSYQEIEIFSGLDWWKRDPDEVPRTCKEPVSQSEKGRR